MVKIQVVALDEAASFHEQIESWQAAGWEFRGFLRRAPGIWDRAQAVFEQEVRTLGS